MRIKYLYNFVLCISLTSCNSACERQKALRDLPDTYCLNTITTDKAILKLISCDTLKLILHEDLTYEFIPKLKVLEGMDGKWSLSDDYEISYWVFKMKNGKTQYNRFLGVNFSDKEYRIDSLVKFTDCPGGKRYRK
jgi:hypothetical protein